MTDLTALNALLDEDEAAAKSATPGPWRAVTSAELEEIRNDPDREEDPRPWTRPTMGEDESRSDGDKIHISRHDPMRVLRDGQRDRAIIAECERTLAFEDYGYALASSILRIMADWAADLKSD